MITRRRVTNALAGTAVVIGGLGLVALVALVVLLLSAAASAYVTSEGSSDAVMQFLRQSVYVPPSER